MRHRSLAVALLLGSLSLRADIPCPVAGDTPIVITQVQEAGSGDWSLTAAELLATGMQRGTAIVVQTEIKGALVDVIVWVWGDVSKPTPASSPGWRVERFFSVVSAAERYEELAATNTSTRIVSSPWGGVGCRHTILDRYSDVAWVVYFDPDLARRRAVRH